MPPSARCPSCGRPVAASDATPAGDDRCPGCGRRLADPPDDDPADDDRPALPLCPGCEKPVGWDVERCPYCGEEFEPEATDTPAAHRGRRDCLPDRGHALAAVSTAALVLTTVAFCFGAVALLALPLGVAAWVTAAGDLRRIDAGVLDRRGRKATTAARVLAVLAVLASSCLALYTFGQLLRL